MKKVTVLQMLVINAYWVGISFMWNSLHPIVLPAVLANLVPAGQKNTWLGVLTFVGLIIAMIVQPAAGAVSDWWASRWGRRRPFILFGTRSVVGIFAIVGYVLAALAAAGAVFSLVKVNIGAGLLGLAFALFIVIITRMGKEMSLMVADASDALVRMAARGE